MSWPPAGLRRRVSRFVPYFHTALELAAQSDRILTVSERIAHQQLERLGLRAYAPPLELKPFALSAVWHPRHDRDPEHQWLRHVLYHVAHHHDGLAHPDPRRQLDPERPHRLEVRRDTPRGQVRHTEP